jgi:hypothetical protein
MYNQTCIYSYPFAAAFFCAAHLFRCASPIRLRASALMTRLRRGFDVDWEELTALPPRMPVPAKRARACWRRAISASMLERRLSKLMEKVYKRGMFYGSVFDPGICAVNRSCLLFHRHKAYSECLNC